MNKDGKQKLTQIGRVKSNKEKKNHINCEAVSETNK